MNLIYAAVLPSYDIKSQGKQQMSDKQPSVII